MGTRMATYLEQYEMARRYFLLQSHAFFQSPMEEGLSVSISSRSGGILLGMHCSSHWKTTISSPRIPFSTRVSELHKVVRQSRLISSMRRGNAPRHPGSQTRGIGCWRGRGRGEGWPRARPSGLAGGMDHARPSGLFLAAGLSCLPSCGAVFGEFEKAVFGEVDG